MTMKAINQWNLPPRDILDFVLNLLRLGTVPVLKQLRDFLHNLATICWNYIIFFPKFFFFFFSTNSCEDSPWSLSWTNADLAQTLGITYFSPEPESSYLYCPDFPDLSQQITSDSITSKEMISEPTTLGCL